MKKLTLLLLLIPILSFGQISYKDIMKVNSKNSFLSLMIDKGFSAITYGSPSIVGTRYALSPVNSEDGVPSSTAFATYYDAPSVMDYGEDFFEFQFARTSTTGQIISNPYDTIFKRVKRRCKFVGFYQLDENNFACYKCKDAEFEGYIALTVIRNMGQIAQVRSKFYYEQHPLQRLRD